MPRAAQKPLLDVADILHKTQETTGCHQKYARMLWTVEAADSNKCYQEIFQAVTFLVTVPQRTNAHVERSLRFLAVFVEEAPERADGSSATFIQDLIADLLKLATAADKVVRMRSCSLLSNIMQRLRLDVEDEILDDVQKAMLERLKDKVPQVRMQAAATLERLAEPGEDGTFQNDPVVAAYRRLINCEKSKDIRKCLLAIMPIAKGAIAREILNRTRDSNDIVRRQAYLVLSTKVNVHDLTAKERAEILSNGLADRSPSVAAAARALCQTWLTDSCDSNILQFLDLINVDDHPGEAESALDALNLAGSLDLKDIAGSAKRQGQGLHSPPGTLLSKTEAFFWRWMSGWLHKSSKEHQKQLTTQTGAAARVLSAALDDLLQIQEDLLPDSNVALLSMIVRHIEAGVDHTCSVTQLLQIITSCADLCDAAVRQEALDMLQALLQQPVREYNAHSWCKAVYNLVSELHNSAAERHQWLREAISSVQSMCSSEIPETRLQHQLKALELSCALFRDISRNGHASDEEQGLLDRLIYPGLTENKSAPVREAAACCLGLYALCTLSGFEVGHEPSNEQMLPIFLLKAALEKDKSPPVRAEAAKAICDLLLVHGAKRLDACHLSTTEHPDQFLAGIPTHNFSSQAVDAAEAADAREQRLTRLLLKALPSLTQAAKKGDGDGSVVSPALKVGTCTAEGLAKLVVHHNPMLNSSSEASEMLEVLATLLVLWADPRTESAVHARQALTIFFPVVACSASGRQMLWTAALMAAKFCQQLPTPMAKKALQKLPAFVLQLIQVSPNSSEEGQDLVSQAAEDTLVGMVALCGKTAVTPSQGALLRLLAGMPLQQVPAAKLQRLIYLTGQLQVVLRGSNAKEVVQLSKRIKAASPEASEPLSEEDVEGLCKRVKSLQEEISEASAGGSPVSSRTRRRNSTQSVSAATLPPGQEADEADDSSSASSS